MLSCGRAPYPSGDDAHKRTFRQSKGKSVRHKRKKWRCLSETAGEASLAIFAGVTHPCQLSPTIFPGDATVSVGHRRPAQRNFTGDAAVTLPLRAAVPISWPFSQSHRKIGPAGEHKFALFERSEFSKFMRCKSPPPPAFDDFPRRRVGQRWAPPPGTT